MLSLRPRGARRTSGDGRMVGQIGWTGTGTWDVEEEEEKRVNAGQ